MPVGEPVLRTGVRATHTRHSADTPAEAAELAAEVELAVQQQESVPEVLVEPEAEAAEVPQKISPHLQVRQEPEAAEAAEVVPEMALMVMEVIQNTDIQTELPEVPEAVQPAEAEAEAEPVPIREVPEAKAEIYRQCQRQAGYMYLLVQMYMAGQMNRQVMPALHLIMI